MTVAKKDAAGGEPVAWENPLIPNKKLRALYVAMAELRLLDEQVGRQRRSKAAGRAATIRGEEGCRVSTTFDLNANDLISEAPSAGVATSFLRGAKLADVIKPGRVDISAQLPAVDDSIARLHLALGAAVVLKTARKGALLIVYVHNGEIALNDWKPILGLAAEQVLPVIFVVLPSAQAKLSKPGQLSLASNKCGVPGISVDAADPVALFRVAQESMLRSRAGGGPVLMECIPFQSVGRKVEPADPLQTMQQFLLHRRIVDDAWLSGVESSFTARLKAAAR